MCSIYRSRTWYWLRFISWRMLVWWRCHHPSHSGSSRRRSAVNPWPAECETGHVSMFPGEHWNIGIGWPMESASKCMLSMVHWDILTTEPLCLHSQFPELYNMLYLRRIWQGTLRYQVKSSSVVQRFRSKFQSLFPGTAITVELATPDVKYSGTSR